MAHLNEADFYYGSAISTLLNNHVSPTLIEAGHDYQLYDLATNNGDFRLFLKYRSQSTRGKRGDRRSWQFTLSEKDIDILKKYCLLTPAFSTGLICGETTLTDSLYAVIHRDEIQQILSLDKTSITLNIGPGEHNFRLPIGHRRDNALLIPTSRLY